MAGSGSTANSMGGGFGKHHASMYRGSMVGKGAEVFAVMGYVIANMVPDREVEGRMVVELNPELLAFIIGEPEAEIEAAIELLCSPDAKSRSKEEDGRRLVRVGQFEYYVVNGWKYRVRRDPEKRREQNLEAQRRYRAKKKEAVVPTKTAAERLAEKGEGFGPNGNQPEPSEELRDETVVAEAGPAWEQMKSRAQSSGAG